jgi:competence protein ComEC
MRAGLIFFLVSLAFATLWRCYDRFFSGTLRIVFFDVGQGDAALIRFPEGTTWLVDAGGGWKKWDVGQRELFLELARMGILTLDLAVLSHPDADHGMGFRGLLQNTRIREWAWNAAFLIGEHPLMQELSLLAKSQSTSLRPLSRALEFKKAGVKARLVPLRAGPSKNENPLAVWLQFAGCRVLLAGDAETRAEKALLETDPFPVDILKVNHHGSATSSTEVFLSSIRPVWSVVSVGAKNPYGHPHQSAMQRLRATGSRVLRTDRLGFIEFTVRSTGKLFCRSAQGSCGESLCARPW